MLAHNSVIDHSGADVLHNNILNEKTIRAATGITNSKIFGREYIMKLNDSIAMTMLQTKFMDAYIDYGSDAGVFMSTLLFPLTCGFSDTS